MRSTLLTCLAATTLVLAACGGSDDDASTDTSADTVAEATDDSSADTAAADTSGDTVAEPPATADTSDESGDPQDRVVALLLDTSNETGIELDEDCVKDKVGQLSDDDATAIADAELGGDPDISDEADAIGETLFTDCVDAASYAAVQAEAIAGVDDSIDVDCILDALDGLTVEEIDDQLIDVSTTCTTGEAGG